MKKVILNLGAGTLTKGCETIIGEILAGVNAYPLRFTGKLPAAPALAATQQQWQQLHNARNQDQALRIQLLEVEGLRYSESAFQKVCSDLVWHLNNWLNTPEFLSVDRILRTELERDDSVQIILETTDLHLRKLPWHLWRLFEDYPHAELTFSNCDWRPLPPPVASTAQSRILATFGNSDGLDLTADLAALHSLSSAELTVLNAPDLNRLHEELWQPQGWDIFFFAGHSQTEGETGVIDLNETQRLTIEQIKYALGKAIAKGLKIAIFNSCDGLGLAQQLSELQIPYVVVMREPVPDAVAQQFLDYLLASFAEGMPFHLAVREARQRLAGLENDIPCASWLPIIWQNPTAPAIYWRDLQGQPVLTPTQTAQRQWRPLVMKSLATGSIVLGLRALALLMPLEFAAYDQLMRQRPVETLDSKISMIEISQEATNQYGYPLPDEVLTAVIDKVNEAQPLVIGVDLHRAKPSPARGNIAVEAVKALTSNQSVASNSVSDDPTDLQPPITSYARFLQQVETTPNLVLVCVYNSNAQIYRTPPQLSQQVRETRLGFSDIPIDVSPNRWIKEPRSDLPAYGNRAVMGAIARRQVLSYGRGLRALPSSTCTTSHSLSFQLAYRFLQQQGVAPLAVTERGGWQFGSVVLDPMPQRFGAYQSLEASINQLMINYRANQPGQKITLNQLLSDSFDPRMLKDQVVIIGYTAPVSRDYFKTPYGPMPGMWVHAHMVSQLLGAVQHGRPLIHTLPQWHNLQWGDMLWVLSWSGLGGYIGWAVKSRSHWQLALALSYLGLYGVCWMGLIAGLWLPLVPSAIALTGSTFWLRLGAHPSRIGGAR